MPNGHDARYKELFSKPLMVKRLVDSFVDTPDLGGEIIAVEPVEKEAVVDFMRRRQSDVLWKLRTATSEFYIYLLMEFQSTVEHAMALRFLEYVAHLYRLLYDVHGGKSVPPIFPVLLYNGDDPWTAPLSIQEMQTAPLMSQSYFPQFSYYPIVIRDIPLERLLQVGNAVAAVFYVENTDPHDLDETMDVLTDILKEEMPELRRAFSQWFMRYLESYAVPFDYDEIERRIARRQSMFGAKLEKYQEELRQEGEQRGRQETIEQTLQAIRLLRGGASAQDVAASTGLPLESVQKLASEIGGGE